MADIITTFNELLNGKYPIKLVGNDVDGYALATTADGGGNPLPSTVLKDGKILSVVGTTPTWTTPPASGSASLSGGMSSGGPDGTYVGLGRSFSNAISNTDPLDSTYATIAPVDGTLHDLAVYGNASAVDPNTFTVYVNGNVTTLSTVIVAGAKGYDNTHSVAVNKGDILMLKVVSAPDIGLRAWSCMFTPS